MSGFLIHAQTLDNISIRPEDFRLVIAAGVLHLSDL